MTHPPDDAVGLLAAQGSVDGRWRFPQDARQFRRVDERHPAEEVEQLSIGEGHVTSAHALGSESTQEHGAGNTP